MKPHRIEHLLTDWPGIKLDMICKGEESVVLTIDDLDRLAGEYQTLLGNLNRALRWDPR